MNESTEAQFEFDGAIYRVAKYVPGTPKEELKDFVLNTSHGDKTTYYFYFPESIDLSVFSTEKFSKEDFYQTIIDAKPDYGFYKMPTDSKIFEDAVWLLEQSQK